MSRHQLIFEDNLGTEEREIKRNLRILFDTRAGTQPCLRDFGISWECLDEIPEVAENLFVLEAHEKVAQYEPRVEIRDITFQHMDGMMVPCIYFARKEEG